MTSKARPKLRAAAAGAPAPARKGRERQRQRLIEACISALHLYGPSRTTVEKVVAIAKMSPGIVRFYFDSKAAMLIASLQFLSTEFEEQLLAPVAAMKADPVAALETLVDLYLDPHLASPRKVSVWYAFWGEASSRQEYYDICGNKDESFAVLVKELVARLIHATARTHLDPEGIALGLIGALEILWQDFAFREEHEIDRKDAKARCMAFLGSVFPGEFGAAAGAVVAGPRPPATEERDAVFRHAWGFAGHDSELPHAHDFLTVELAAERVLLVRGVDGEVLAFRNNCPITPHRLVVKRNGRLDGDIECRTHSRRFGLAELRPLEARSIAGLVFVREPSAAAPSAFALPSAAELPAGLMALDGAREIRVEADWKLIVEQWLEGAPQTAWSVSAGETWSGRAYSRLMDCAPAARWQRRFIGPNQLLEVRPDGASVVAVLPAGPGRSVVRRLDCTILPPDATARAVLFLAQRLGPYTRRAVVEVAESLQRGIAGFGYEASAPLHDSPAAAAFRRWLTSTQPRPET